MSKIQNLHCLILLPLLASNIDNFSVGFNEQGCKHRRQQVLAAFISRLLDFHVYELGRIYTVSQDYGAKHSKNELPSAYTRKNVYWMTSLNAAASFILTGCEQVQLGEKFQHYHLISNEAVYHFQDPMLRSGYSHISDVSKDGHAHFTRISQHHSLYMHESKPTQRAFLPTTVSIKEKRVSHYFPRCYRITQRTYVPIYTMDVIRQRDIDLHPNFTTLWQSIIKMRWHWFANKPNDARAFNYV
ncbi:hypothetical protein BDF20DRAFT_992172 [Mycotypha africana]|uniref:uncharacterized protein n=1 Tax=Mycotypha africana TaxID=64632 RepID=UPI002300D0B1|nr:uncharacterized protein BDF20DRAFT_992172 [Mycotypha africana]KAI8967189.1 hypothetical protein BDF20DRAFT_992172 [Mycotypha africana]